MKNSAYYNSKIKHQLREKKERRVKFVVWSLKPEQIEFIYSLGYRVEEYLYQVKTEHMYDIHSIKSKTLKEIHFKNKKGIKTMVMELNPKNKKLLDEYGIRYKPYKFKIFLNE